MREVIRHTLQATIELNCSLQKEVRDRLIELVQKLATGEHTHVQIQEFIGLIGANAVMMAFANGTINIERFGSDSNTNTTYLSEDIEIEFRA